MLREPSNDSWTDIVVPPVIKKWIFNKIGIEKDESIKIPEGKSEEDAIEELSQIWFEIMTSEPGFYGLPRDIFTNNRTARKFQDRACDLGIEFMLEAWSKKVPLSDILI